MIIDNKFRIDIPHVNLDIQFLKTDKPNEMIVQARVQKGAEFGTLGGDLFPNTPRVYSKDWENICRIIEHDGRREVIFEKEYDNPQSGN